MANDKKGLLGRKVGMTQLFDEDGTVLPVTVIEAGPCTVTQVKTEDGSDGYNAIQLSFGTKPERLLNKPSKGHAAKANTTPGKFVTEIRLSKADAAAHTRGQVLVANDVFKAGDRIDVIGTSKGRGFQGVIKRHHMSGFVNGHGTHEYFRHGGSIGTRLTPGFTFRGKKMPGQMGNERVTVPNVKIARIDAERNLVYVVGGVPGPNGAYVAIKHTVKRDV